VMARSNELGMMTFDQSLYMLYQAGRISIEQALLNADSKTDLKLRIKLSTPFAEFPPVVGANQRLRRSA
jgi:twitching motility protein PilU